MRPALFIASCLAALAAAGCAVPYDDAQYSAQRTLAAQACTGSGFVATGTIAAPGVPCSAVQGMVGGPPQGPPTLVQ